ncbi:MAG: aldehyde dehydrogenase family protein [Myxococcales bacterium]|nr:aldehyde dehydrogenase family protein [Myxococcales bacterium]
MPDFSQPETRLFIDGDFRAARSGRSFDNVDPATEEAFGICADAGPEDMREAIDAAQRAFDATAWASDVALRKRVLTQLREGLEKEKEHLRLQTVREVGSPIQLTYGPQMQSVLDDMQWVIDLLDRYAFEHEIGVHEFFGMKSQRIVRREPVGVVAAISPWNFPIQVTWAKTMPALAAGNTVVLKPAPDTPYHATFLARVAAEYTDMPKGVLNVVTAHDPAEVGEVLTTDPRVGLVSFTGSTAVGRRIMANASATLKKVFLELGGKSANIVLDDADFGAVLPSAAMTCMHGGQGCAITTRLLLPRARYDEGLAIVKAAFEAVKYGDPMDPQNIQGPQVSRRQQERVLDYVRKGVEEGARLVVGGKRPAHLPKGFYVEPTLFADVDNAMTIAQEEIFGPVLVAIPYEDDDDAVRIANDSIYGLSGAVLSASQERAMAVARRLRTGTVGVNGGMWFGPDSPFGGYKQSGIGREMGVQGFEEYLETKTIGVRV